MRVTTREVGGVTVLDLNGRITLDVGSPVLRNVLHELIRKGKNKILLNMAEVTYVDSSGVGALVGAFATVRKQNGQIKLLKLTHKVRDLLHLTNLISLFEIHDDEASAILSFQQ